MYTENYKILMKNMKDLSKQSVIPFSRSENSEKKGLSCGVEFKNRGEILNILAVYVKLEYKGKEIWTHISPKRLKMSTHRCKIPMKPQGGSISLLCKLEVTGVTSLKY